MRLFLPGLNYKVMNKEMINGLPMTKAQESIIYSAEGVHRLSGDSYTSLVPHDVDPKEVRIGNHSFLLDGSYWEEGEEVHRIPVDFVRRDKKSVSYTLGYDPKVAFVTEEVNGSTEDAYFHLELGCFEDGEIKAPVKEKILTLLSMINFC